MCGAWHHLVGIIVDLYLFLCVVVVILKISSVLSHRSIFTVWNFSLMSSNKYEAMMTFFRNCNLSDAFC